MRRALVISSLILTLLALVIAPCARAAAGKPPLAESYLHQGTLAAGERALIQALKVHPKDDEVRFGLGAIQFVRAVEARIQAFYRYGYGILPATGLRSVLTNLPIPPNPKPERLDSARARVLLQSWIDDLARVEKTLAGITDPDVKLPLHFGLVRLDFNADGTLDDDETLGNVYSRFNPTANPAAARDFVIVFDRGDVDWLRGYSHLLSAITEVLLAYDFSAPFDTFGYLAFRGMRPPHPFMNVQDAGPGRIGVNDTVFDAVGLIHAIRLPVIEPARMKSALTHLEAVTALSRSSWKAIRGEADDDHEWVPNSKQQSVMPNSRVTPEMIEAWFTFLDEFDAILAGRTLVPFWRGNDPHRGINVRKVFTAPTALDLVMWVQGSGVAPYLEEGDVTSRAVWERINRIFHGEFVGFAIWFN